MALELGATQVLTGVVVPPQVEAVISRWLPLARHRAEAEGWWPTLEPGPEPWERPELFLPTGRTGPKTEPTPDPLAPHSLQGLRSMFGKKSPNLTEQDVLAALKGVKDPDIQRDLVDLGMIKDIRIGDGSVALTVNLTTPACPLKAKIEADVRQALTSRLGTELTYTISMSADVRGKGIAEKGDIPGVKNVIAVGSGKGGVGKSTMAASIAFGLQAYGSKVGLMDADVYGPSIPHLVGARGTADGGRRADRADRSQWPEVDVDGVSARTRTRRDHARADASRNHAAIPPSGRMGSARLPRNRPAARAPATSR